MTTILAERAALAAEELVSNTVGLHSERHAAVTVAEQLVQAFVSAVFVSYETPAHGRPIPVASVSVRVRRWVSARQSFESVCAHDNEDKHVAEHEPQLVQAPMVQSVQVTPVNELHRVLWFRAGQAAPFGPGYSMTFRLRVELPDAQSEPHEPHAPQSVTRQFVTQVSVLHAIDSDVVSGQGLVEAQGLVTVRERL